MKRKEVVGFKVYLGTPLALETCGGSDGAVASPEQGAEALDLVLGVNVDAEVSGRGGAAGVQGGGGGRCVEEEAVEEAGEEEGGSDEEQSAHLVSAAAGLVVPHAPIARRSQRWGKW